MRLPQSLPGPKAEVWDWQRHARCRGETPSVFFSPEGERGRARWSREQQAKDLCRKCLVLVQCRTHALAIPEPYGVWGGMSEAERNNLLGLTPS
ncbi:WhiB family transcriptional regulator [Mycolicibacterium nivoides]|uniref:WhiB family transcriptional regulator n=1 Tax=Mycolicibacterium nivoides TaxID=2487344 RepID=UPI003C2FC939